MTILTMRVSVMGRRNHLRNRLTDCAASLVFRARHVGLADAAAEVRPKPATTRRRLRKMDAYIYGERLPLPEGFAAYHDRCRSAVVSIDMHQGHLADTPDCPCPAPRARELVAPIDAFHDQARRLGVPIIHVRTILRKRGVDDVNGLKAAWRLSSHFTRVTSPTQTSMESRERAGPSS